MSPPVLTYAAPVLDPFSAVITAIKNLTLPKCKGSTLQSYATGQCANDNITINSATTLTVSGVYFFSGGLSLGGNGSLATGPGVSATIIVLPVSGKNAALKMAGGSTFNITAPVAAPSGSAIPTALGSVASKLANMAIFDPETSPQITGNATMSGSGVFYLPNAALNYQGSPSSTSTCTEVLAASIQFSGTPNFDNSGCPNSIKLTSQRVLLVQ
jgi:hypothetical protein